MSNIEDDLNEDFDQGLAKQGSPSKTEKLAALEKSKLSKHQGGFLETSKNDSKKTASNATKHPESKQEGSSSGIDEHGQQTYLNENK